MLMEDMGAKKGTAYGIVLLAREDKMKQVHIRVYICESVFMH